MNHPEKGRELRLWDLIPRTVYVLSKEGRPSLTAWFRKQSAVAGIEHAEFLAAKVNTILILRAEEDGTLLDDSGMKITVNEYLGEV